MDENNRNDMIEKLVLIDRVNSESVMWDALVTEKLKIMDAPAEQIELSESITNDMHKLKSLII